MRTALRVQTQDWRHFETVATYAAPMGAEADAFKLVEAGMHVEVSTWARFAPHQTTLRLGGRSRVWIGSREDWALIDA